MKKGVKSTTKAAASKSPHSLKPASAEANRLAVAILEVLAGLRTPTEAAEALQISLPRYYQLEIRALQGLVSACESRKKGPGVRLETKIARLEAQLAKAESEVARQQALVRAAQRTVGLKAAVAAEKKSRSGAKSNGKPGTKPKRRKRRPTVRALRAISVLSENGRDGANVRVEGESADTGQSAAGGMTDARPEDNGTTTRPANRRLRRSQTTSGGDPPDADGRADDR